MEEIVKVKFVTDHAMAIHGKETRFKTDQIAELPKAIALELFKKDIVLPGPEFGASIPMDS